MSYHQQVINEFNDLVLEKIGERISLLKTGYSVKDFADYKALIGEVKGLETAIELLNEAKVLVEKRT
jgi:hypothetical protein